MLFYFYCVVVADKANNIHTEADENKN